MLWFKALKDFKHDEKSFVKDQVAAVDAADHAYLLAKGLIEKADKPAEAASIDEELHTALKAEVESQFGELQSMIKKELATTVKGASDKRRQAIITVTKENADDDPTDGFKSFGEYLKCVNKASIGHGVDERLTKALTRQKANGLSEGVNADGGYTVPVQYADNVWNDIEDQTDIMSQCLKIPMTTNSMKLPAINYTKQGSFGISANWEGEAAQIPPSKAAFRQPQLVLNKLTVLAPVTNELLEDGIAIESTITDLASKAMTFKLTDAVLFGTGAGMPTGVVGHPSTVVKARTTTGQIKAQDIVNMTSALNPQATNPVWLINKGAVLPALLTIQDPAGRYLYFSPGSFGDKPMSSRLNGIPVMPLANNPDLGTPGDIILADLGGYAVGYKSTGVQRAMSIHVYFATDEVAFRWTYRIDGRPMRDVPLQAARGNATYGSAVVLSA